MSGESAALYSYPRGATSQELYNSMRLLVDQLRRVRTQDAIDDTTLQSVAETIGAELQAQIEADLLTPDEAFDLMLSAIADSIFGAASASANAAWAEANVLAASKLRTVLQSYVQQASLSVEQTVRQTETLSLASQITTLTASLATTAAAVVTEATARATGDSANAAAITTVQTQANGNTASITALQTSDDGIEAQWGVVISLNGQVTGLVRLDAGASGSNFVVVADKFVVALPGSPGTTITAFVAGLVNGVATVGINGDLLVDGTILARSIAANTITAAKIAAGTITADRLSVSTLSAITANVGTLNAGLIQSASGNSYFNLTTGDLQLGA